MRDNNDHQAQRPVSIEFNTKLYNTTATAPAGSKTRVTTNSTATFQPDRQTVGHRGRLPLSSTAATVSQLPLLQGRRRRELQISARVQQSSTTNHESPQQTQGKENAQHSLIIATNRYEGITSCYSLLGFVWQLAFL